MYTDITVVLDRSGSMSSIRNDMIGGFNEFIKEQRLTTDIAKVNITLYRFDDVFETVYQEQNVNSELVFLNEANFTPRGGTALLEAIGRAISLTGDRLRRMPESERPDKVVFMIITDGHENSSGIEFSYARISEMIKHQTEKYAWNFTFLGANQDAIAAAGSIGIYANAALTYAANSGGVMSAFAVASANIGSLTRGTAEVFNYSEEDRKAAVDEK